MDLLLVYLGAAMASFSLLTLLFGALGACCALIWGALLIRFAVALRSTSSRRGSGTVTYPGDETPFVSVVIAARNEAEKLPATLSSVLEQAYPHERYEVIVIDDCSEDNTAGIVMEAVSEDPDRIRLVCIEEVPAGWTGKKWALHQGIGRASGEIIVTTDADCLAGPYWLDRMIAPFVDERHTDLAGGPVDYVGAVDWRWPRRLLRTEFLSLSLVGGGSIESGMPLMVSAQNMAYRREVYESVDGHTRHAEIPSGDDVFLLFDAHRAGSGACYVFDSDAVVTTHAPGSVTEFYNQRARWVSKGTKYPLKKLFLSSLVWLVNTLVLGGVITAIAGVTPGLWPWLIASLILKGAGEVAILMRGREIGMRGILLDYLTGLIVHIPYVVLVGIAGTLRIYRWK